MKKIVLICDYKLTDTIYKDNVNYNRNDYNELNMVSEDYEKVVYRTLHVVAEAKTVKSACRWIGVPDYTLYANKRNTGYLKTKKYLLEKVKVRNEDYNSIEWERYDMIDTIHK